MPSGEMTESSSNSCSRRPITLTSLPKELLTQIALLLDRPTAVSFARVSSIITLCAEPAIWRHIDLSLNPHYGEYPLIEPHVRTAARPSQQWSIGVAKEAEERHRAALRQKVMEVVKRADHRRCEMIEEISMVVRPGAINGMLCLLNMVGANLTTLVITSPIPHIFERHWAPKEYELLDSESAPIQPRLIDSGIHLPSLITLRIGPGVLRHYCSIYDLLHIAPALSSLTLHLDRYFGARSLHVVYPHQSSPTLSELYITTSKDAEGASHDFAQRIADLLLHTPKLRRLSLDYNGPLELGQGLLMDGVGHLQDLLEVNWSIETPRLIDFDWSGFVSLRRAIFKSTGWDPIDEDMPIIPTIEVIYYTPWLGVDIVYPRNSDNFDLAADCQSFVMHPTYVAELVKMPRLKGLHLLRPSEFASPDLFNKLDDIESKEILNVKINSVRNAGSEMFNGLQLSPYQQITSHPISEKLLYLPPGCHVEVKETADDFVEVVWYRSRSSTVQLGSCFDGHKVPVNIIEEMKEAEGKPDTFWRGRGIQVQEATWSVLVNGMAGRSVAIEAVNEQ